MRTDLMNKDLLGAALLVVLGCCVSIAAIGYDTGSLTDMGAGFLPAVFGSLMVVVGIMIGLTSRKMQGVGSVAQHGPAALPDLRGALAILAGVIAFVLLGDHGGLIPASFVSVFIAASGDREHSWRSAALLAASVTIFAVLVFYFALQVKMPLLTWG